MENTFLAHYTITNLNGIVAEEILFVAVSFKIQKYIHIHINSTVNVFNCIRVKGCLWFTYITKNDKNIFYIVCSTFERW